MFVRAPFANSCVGERNGEDAYLLVDFRASRLAFDRNLCHGEERRERERCIVGDAEDKGGKRRGGDVQGGGVEGT